MTEDALPYRELVQSMSQQAQLLLAASGIEPTGQTDVRDEVVRLCLLRSSDLLRRAAVLGREQNNACLGILARSLLESLISTLWILISVENAERQQKAADAELSRALKINLHNGMARVLNAVSGEDETQEFLMSDQMKKIPKRMSVVDQAADAGVSDLYNIFYRFLSLETHGHQLESSEGESPEHLSAIHLQVIGAISRAIGHAGVRWFLHRERTDNESLRTVLGFSNVQA